jgi:hypothetical protein
MLVGDLGSFWTPRRRAAILSALDTQGGTPGGDTLPAREHFLTVRSATAAGQ